MAEKHLVDVLDGIGTSWGGRVSFGREVVTPLMTSVSDSLHAAGLSQAVDNPRIPSRFRGGRPRHFLGDFSALTPDIVVVTAFVGGAIAGWVVDRVCNALWDGHIAPAIRNVFRRESASAPAVREFAVRFQVYYAADEVLVTTRTLVTSTEDMDAFLHLVPEAERRALKWFENKGIDCDEVVFTVQNGELSNIPRVIRQAQPNQALQPTSRARSARAKSKKRSRAARG